MRRAILGSVFLSLVAIAAPTPAAAQVEPDRFVPFGQFIAGVRVASPAAHVGRPGNSVANANEFEKMRQYALEVYRGVPVVRSFVLDGGHFDCVPIRQQPTVHMLGLTGISSPPPEPPAPPTNSPYEAKQVTPNQSADAFGNLIGCPDGTVPFRRVTLEEMTRFESIGQYFLKGKAPIVETSVSRLPNYRPQAADPCTNGVIANHKYATACQTTHNFGGRSRISLWNPTVTPASGQDFSLAQHWYINKWVGGAHNGQVQTVEGGWIKGPAFFGARPILFVFATWDNYNPAHSGYNINFVQTAAGAFLGASFANADFSVNGNAGAQHFISMTWRLYNHDWWLGYGSTWIGYFAQAFYQGGPLPNLATELRYGGETAYHAASTSPMGSGAFANAGWTHAAFHRNIVSFTNNAGAVATPNLAPHQLSPHCYTVSMGANATSAWGRYFFFGGPGGHVGAGC
jgi:hypothetical protein